jgi:hypothetical protein
MLMPGVKGVRRCPQPLRVSSYNFTLPHFALLHIGPLDDFFLCSLRYTLIDETEVYRSL